MPRSSLKLPDLVIRRSGIWNSRAPFHNFLRSQREQSRSYNLLTVAVYQLRYDASSENPERSGAKFLRKVVGVEATASKAWMGYRLSFGRDSEGKVHKPNISELSEDLKESLYHIREAAIVKYSSLFESFAQCWTLNYLLTKLENGKAWTSDEKKLAQWFSPEHGRLHAPGWPLITQYIPDLQIELSKLPHINKHPSTGDDVTSPLSADLNAFRTIKFWRDYRNLVVHGTGLISSAFCKEHSVFFEQLRAPYAAHMPALQPGQQLKFFDTVYPAMTTVHNKAALWMNEWLEKESNQRRGHPQAPNPKTDSFDINIAAAPLLMPGDHSDSYRWITDSAFRARYR